MKKLQCVFSIFVLLLAPFIWAAESTKSIPVPDPVVGDSCTYLKKIQGRPLQPLTQTITATQADGYTAESRNPNNFLMETWEFTAAGNAKSRKNTAGVLTWEPYQLFFKWPAVPGAKWDRFSYTYRLPTGGGGTVQVDGQVENSLEKITVPAGEFTALKFVLKGNYSENTPNGSGSGKRDITIWYIPAINCIARLTLESTRWNGDLAPEETTELIAYRKAS